MQIAAIDVGHAGPHILTELGTGLIHGQENPGNAQTRIEPRLDCPDQFQDLRNTLAGQKMCLDRNNAVIRGGEGVHCQKFVLQSAVNHDVIVLLDHKLDDIGKNLLALPIRIAYSVVLVHLHHKQAGGGIVQTLVGRNQVNTALRMQDTPGQVDFQVLRGVDGREKHLCQGVLLLSRGKPQRRREIPLRVGVNQQDAEAGIGKGYSQIQRGSRLSDASLRVGNGNDRMVFHSRFSSNF